MKKILFILIIGGTLLVTSCASHSTCAAYSVNDTVVDTTVNV